MDTIFHILIKGNKLKLSVSLHFGKLEYILVTTTVIGVQIVKAWMKLVNLDQDD